MFRTEGIRVNSIKELSMRKTCRIIRKCSSGYKDMFVVYVGLQEGLVLGQFQLKKGNKCDDVP